MRHATQLKEIETLLMADSAIKERRIQSRQNMIFVGSGEVDQGEFLVFSRDVEGLVAFDFVMRHEVKESGLIDVDLDALQGFIGMPAMESVVAGDLRELLNVVRQQFPSEFDLGLTQQLGN